MKPICVKCRRFFRPKKNGFYFLEGRQKEMPAAPGLAEPEKWQPYKLWAGDQWECQGCGVTIIVGTGQKPLAEHFEADFDQAVKAFNPKLQVNDC
jgi:hypothetical protein